jgi:hypothetical protein
MHAGCSRVDERIQYNNHCSGDEIVRAKKLCSLLMMDEDVSVLRRGGITASFA